MDKKMMAIIIALLSSTSIATAVYAQKKGYSQVFAQSIIPEVVQIYPRPSPEVTIGEGIAFDKNTQESKQVVFLVMRYGDKGNTYLIIDDQTYKMTEVTNATSNLGPGTKVIKYRSEDGSILTILAQRFEQWGQISISGDFKNYLIVFKPMYYYDYTRPVPVEPYGVTERIVDSGRIIEPQSEFPGLGSTLKEMRKEVIEDTRPVMKGLREIAQKEGVDIAAIPRQAKPIVEWFD